MAGDEGLRLGFRYRSVAYSMTSWEIFRTRRTSANRLCWEGSISEVFFYCAQAQPLRGNHPELCGKVGLSCGLRSSSIACFGHG